MSESSVWALAGWTMLHYLWSGSVFTLVAWIGRRALRSAHPDVMSAYSLACLGVLTLMPILIAGWVHVNKSQASPVTPRLNLEARGSTTIPPEPSAPAIDFPLPRSQPQPRREPFGLATVASWLPSLWLMGTPITFGWLAPMPLS